MSWPDAFVIGVAIVAVACVAVLRPDALVVLGVVFIAWIFFRALG